MVDENLPPPLARALAALFVGQHEVVHLRDRFGPKVQDVDWLTALNREGSWVILSADRRITKNKSEQRVFHNSKHIGFFFAPGLPEGLYPEEDGAPYGRVGHDREAGPARQRGIDVRDSSEGKSAEAPLNRSPYPG